MRPAGAQRFLFSILGHGWRRTIMMLIMVIMEAKELSLPSKKRRTLRARASEQQYTLSRKGVENQWTATAAGSTNYVGAPTLSDEATSTVSKREGYTHH
jgi:hypothetical protein